MSKDWKKIVVGAIIGVIAGVSSQHLLATPAAAAPHPVRDQNQTYTFINPLLFYNSPSDPSAYKDVLAAVQQRIDQFTRAMPGGTASIYLKDLNAGTWAGINTSEQYNPASLLKVSVMMAYYKEAESNAAVLNRSLVYTQAVRDSYTDIPYEQGTELVLGGSYSIENLIERMVEQSDNGATYTLLASINDTDLADVFSTLGIDNPDQKGRDYTISPGTYSYFFRVLYNATYLSREMSEKALSLLSQSTFKDGLVAGLPAGTTVAHKFGENAITAPDGSVSQVELHDCGIVYYPKDAPYLLCVMTRGAHLDDLQSLIGDISKIVYTNANKK